MHQTFGLNANYDNWVIIVVGVSLEAFFIFVSAMDSLRKNPKEKLFGAKIFNLPVFTVSVAITIAIFWGDPGQFAIVYGAICGGFAGHLAGALAYANFFIHIKDSIYRIIFGGWIGVLLGAIFGALFAGLVDPIGGQVFGGIFMGFWGGAIVSGPIATILLYYLKGKEKFTAFFTTIMVLGLRSRITRDIKLYFETHDQLNLDETVVLKITDKPLSENQEKLFSRIIPAILQFNFVLGMLLLVLVPAFYKFFFFINPWEEEIDQIRINNFNEIIDYAVKELNLTREDNIINK